MAYADCDITALQNLCSTAPNRHASPSVRVSNFFRFVRMRTPYHTTFAILYLMATQKTQRLNINYRSCPLLKSSIQFQMLVTILLVQQVLGFCSQISATPIYGWRLSLGNQAALLHNSAPSRVPEPRYRGTWGILYSCTLTLVLCVYNSLHLNVSAEDESQFSRYLRRIKWALTALVVPEDVLTFAVLQWFEAKLLCNELEELHFRAAEHSPHREQQQQQQISQRVVTCSSVVPSRRKPYNRLIAPSFHLIH
ncbi:hypothetical protein BDD12DRAFT_276022 [Trichophaea hybrida]|nr:hypothetical protein BDD12DRAFT_276022 [Trichophaea hybrida]